MEQNNKVIEDMRAQKCRREQHNDTSQVYSIGSLIANRSCSIFLYRAIRLRLVQYICANKSVDKSEGYTYNP